MPNLALLAGPLGGNDSSMSDVDLPEVNPDDEPGERLNEALNGIDDVQPAHGEALDDVDDDVDENGNINDDDPDL